MTTFRKKCFDLLTPSGVEGVYKKRICACMVLYVLFPLIWYAAWLFSVKNCFDLLNPPQGSCVGVCKDRICACMVLYVPFPFIWYEIWLLSEIFFLTLDPTRGIEGMWMDRICIFFILIVSFQKQHHATYSSTIYFTIHRYMYTLVILQIWIFRCRIMKKTSQDVFSVYMSPPPKHVLIYRLL